MEFNTLFVLLSGQILPMYGFSMSDINNSIREFRLKRGLSATELARKTEGEFSPSRISNYETGVHQLTIEAANCLLDVAVK